MSRNRLISIGAVIVAAIIVAVVFLRRSGGSTEDQAPTPTAPITTAVIRSETLQDVTSAYGVVQADPGAANVLAAPRPVIVTRILVRQGEAVTADQALVEVASAPASDQAYRQAAAATAAANEDLARTQRLYNDRLVASDQLTAARKAVADAQAALVAQQRQGAGNTRQTLVAPQASVVTSIAATVGDRLAQDAPILVLARNGAISVKLGLEPASAHLAAGQPVNIRPVNGGPAIATHLSLVGKAADPTTKTIDAVAPVPGLVLPIGSAVDADIVTGAHVGLVVPRGAVVFDETGEHVFIVVAGKARRVFVTVGRDHGDEVEISGPIAAGQVVAARGAYELQDGMAVWVDGR